MALDDEALAKKLQEQFDGERANHVQTNTNLETSDTVYAKRVQEELNVEDQFEAATQHVQAQQAAKAAAAHDKKAPEKGLLGLFKK